MARTRRLDYDYEPIRDRLRYLCEFLFGGSHCEMARELGVCYRHFYSIIRTGNDHKALTVRMAAQVVSRLGVRAEWFLTGVGPVFATDSPDDGLRLPLRLQSSFPLPDMLAVGSGCPPKPRVPLGAVGPTAPPSAAYFQAATSLFAANGQQAPVALLLGAEAAEQAPVVSVAPLFQDRYVHFLGLTLAAARFDVYSALASGVFDLNRAAVLAANVGMGYGEALATWAFRTDEQRAKSVLATACGANVPVAVFSEIGEIPEHSGPAVRGAELGAAVGAAAYVDHLIFTKYLEAFSAAGAGVIICAGEIARWLAVLCRALGQIEADITLVILVPENQTPPHTGHLAAQVIALCDHPAVFFSHLSSACHTVYANGGLAPQ